MIRKVACIVYILIIVGQFYDPPTYRQDLHRSIDYTMLALRIIGATGILVAIYFAFPPRKKVVTNTSNEDKNK